MLYIQIEADYNDGDYVTSFEKITPEELEIIKPVIEAIKKSSLHNNYMRYVDFDDPKHAHHLYAHLGDAFLLFDKKFVPYHEHGIHTITSIKLLEITSIETLL